MKERLARLDTALYEIEKKIVGVLTLLMGGAMFADVVHRVFSRSPGRLATMLADAGLGEVATLDATVAPVLILLATFLVCFAAIRSRGEPAIGKALGMALVATVALVALVQGFVRFVPEGVVWAPYFSLSLLLWVGLVGASMATYSGRHLALEMGEKIWPENVRPKVRAVAQLAAMAFSVMITILGAMSFNEHLGLWLESPEANLIPSIDLPKWAVFWIVPYAFGVVAIRFFGRATGLLPTRTVSEVPGQESES
jgi:TRAP-type C4-dicarboxylate transport system permease small subunit